jgi:hypothetical protein
MDVDVAAYARTSTKSTTASPRNDAESRTATSCSCLHAARTRRIIIDRAAGSIRLGMLVALHTFSRRFPDLTLAGFRVLWEESDAFMNDVLQLGYEPSGVPGLTTNKTVNPVPDAKSTGGRDT